MHLHYAPTIAQHATNKQAYTYAYKDMMSFVYMPVIHEQSNIKKDEFIYKISLIRFIHR